MKRSNFITPLNPKPRSQVVKSLRNVAVAQRIDGYFTDNQSSNHDYGHRFVAFSLDEKDDSTILHE